MLPYIYFATAPPNLHGQRWAVCSCLNLFLQRTVHSEAHMLRFIFLTTLLLIFHTSASSAQTSNSAISYLNRGNDKYGKNDMSGALKDYNIALTFDSEFAAAYFHRGRIR